MGRVWGEVVWIAWGRGGAWIGLGKRGCPDRFGEEGVRGQGLGRGCVDSLGKRRCVDRFGEEGVPG